MGSTPKPGSEDIKLVPKVGREESNGDEYGGKFLKECSDKVCN